MCTLGMLIVGIGYYKTFIINSGQVVYAEKDSYFANFSRFILSLGRSFVLIFFPKSISAAYYQGSFWNLIGIPLGVVYVFGVLRSKEFRGDIFSWLLLAFLGFVPTLIAFVNDSYLYLFLVSLLIATAYFIHSLDFLRYRFFLKFLLIGYLLFFSVKTIDCSGIWQSNARLWQHSYLNEKSPYSAIILSSHLKDEGTAVELLIWAAEYYDFSRNSQLAIYFTTKLYLSTAITRMEKLKLLKKFYYNFFIYDVYISLLYIQGDMELAKMGLEKLIEMKPRWTSVNVNPPNLKDLIELTLKKTCLADSRKNFFCNKLGIEIGDKKL